jgi:arylsulfatase
VAIVVIDALRADVVGAYGGPGPTPVLDRLAAEGLVFERVYSPFTWTRPAVASLFTGLSAAAHGVVSEDFSLPEGAFTLAERFRLQGYRTIGVVANGHISNAFNFDQGFETYLWEPDSVTASDRASGVRVDYADSRAVFDTALARLPPAAAERPVFLYLQTVDAHEPYSPPEWLLPEPKPEIAANVYLQRLVNQGEAATPQLLEDFALLYRGGVAYSDRELGRFLDIMGERLGEEGTVVVATADHGEAFFEHRFVGHSSWPFEELARVPLILNGPGIPRGQRESALASLLDVLPTVAPRGQAFLTQGVDLLTAGSAMGARAVVSESAEGSVLVSGEWKLSYRPGYPEPLQFRLHNLRNDPFEQADLGSSEPVVMDQLKLQLRSYQRDAKRLALEPLARPARIDQEVVDNLKALGYVR